MSLGHWQGVFDVLVIDTTPGADGPFAPPEHWQGDRAAYKTLIRERYSRNRGAHQQIETTARLTGHAITGPYAEYARQIIEAVRATRIRREAERT
ncbi:hypothetical protein J2T57_002635 [Natronocella acetinitrilica]|uniref:Uncharacterized protein n=1 Tax=Natronocella acetinitrilica TaxID=414046 RepID=A0AAE3KBF9_9GAMM|nr:hypothetical protein [Natronocella acetinitrilica]MCP1675485.1 hypothetical protein [Natronocella acetinitrilica]